MVFAYINENKHRNLGIKIRCLFGGGGRIRTIEAKRSRFTVCKNVLNTNMFLIFDILFDIVYFSSSAIGSS